MNARVWYSESSGKSLNSLQRIAIRIGVKNAKAELQEMSKRAKLLLIFALVVVPVVSVFSVRYFIKRDLTAVQAHPPNGSPPSDAGSSGRDGNGGGGQGMGQGGQGGNRGFMSRPTLVDTAVVTEGSIREQISLTGSLKAKESVEVVPKITGKVQRVLVDVGDPVREGQLIAELEGDELAQQVLRAEATLAVAEATRAQRLAELENAQADDRRAQQLQTEGLLSRQSMETTQTRARVVQTQVTLADAQIRQAQADLNELRIRRQQTQVLSPLTGWVATRHVSPGALVNPNNPIVGVLRLSSMVTEVRVPEEHLTGLRVGNRALVSMDALQGRTIEGRVARISPILDPATRSGSVQVEIPNPDGQLKAEMSARIQMEMGGNRTALLIPREAIVMRGDQPGVNVLEDGRARFRPIETGITTDNGVEVISGLTLGLKIITRGTQGLQDGAPVEVQSGADEPVVNDETTARPGAGVREGNPARSTRPGARS
ncbi:MAG: efflux RND transporter periplasmic adaptor subunit [Acidobacteria bacterium]|nr:efflux RND transporter periplasmic adaptor subunit [Acidobacteriota bacterium]